MIYNLNTDKIEYSINKFADTAISSATIFQMNNIDYYAMITHEKTKDTNLSFLIYAPINDGDNITRVSIKGLNAAADFLFISSISVYEYINKLPIFVTLLSSSDGNYILKVDINGNKIEENKIFKDTDKYFNPSFMNYLGNDSFRMQIGYIFNEGDNEYSVTGKSLISIDAMFNTFDFLELEYEFYDLIMINKSNEADFLVFKVNNNGMMQLFELNKNGDEVREFKLSYKFINNDEDVYKLHGMYGTDKILIEKYQNPELIEFFLQPVVFAAIGLYAVYFYIITKIIYKKPNLSKTTIDPIF